MKGLAVVVVAVVALALTPAASAAAPLNGKYRGTITSGFLKRNWTMDFTGGGPTK